MAQHEAAHAVTAVALGTDHVRARVRPANAGGWKGDSTFPDHLPLGRERIVVKLVGLLAQVRLGGAIPPQGHVPDVERARATAIELVQADPDAEKVTEAQIATILALSGASDLSGV